MAKTKESRGVVRVTNPAMHSRVSYLYQAAAYMESIKQNSSENNWEKGEVPFSKLVSETDDSNIREAQSNGLSNTLKSSCHALPRKLLSDLRSISLKAQLRLSPAMKNSICKRCSTLLIEGSTCINEMENKSKGMKKPWADVLVQKCNSCGSEKRFPVAVERQTRRPNRQIKVRVANNS